MVLCFERRHTLPSIIGIDSGALPAGMCRAVDCAIFRAIGTV
jgi:hypothetical protein